MNSNYNVNIILPATGLNAINLLCIDSIRHHLRSCNIILWSTSLINLYLNEGCTYVESIDRIRRDFPGFIISSSIFIVKPDNLLKYATNSYKFKDVCSSEFAYQVDNFDSNLETEVEGGKSLLNIDYLDLQFLIKDSKYDILSIV